MDVDLLKGCGTVVSYKAGQAICREGETGHSMFVLLKGSVEILINSFSDNPQSLGFMEEGSFFGEMSLLESKPRSATIVACTEEVTVLDVAEADFSMLLLKATSITYRLLLSLNNRLNTMLERINETDKRFVFQYKRNPVYLSVQKMDVRSFDAIAKKDPDYVWTLLKYLSSSLEKLNREYIQQLSK
jgi:signal-transduction protein with cAMP-binding, CBS, and nucleotidyltransferase domain